MPLRPLSRPLAEPGGAQRPTCTILVWGQRAEHAGDRTSSEAAVICSVSQVGWSDGLVRRHPREVSPLARGVISPGGLNPYPPDYRAAFASSLILYPPSHRRTLRWAYPKGGRRAYHVPWMNHGWFRLCLSAGGCWVCGKRDGNSCTSHVPFGSSLTASWACRR